MPSEYDYLCVIDFEATCEVERSDFFPHEIIEFPAILIHVENQIIVSSFHAFVKPTLNPILSNFCKRLTGITQESVDNAETFPYVLLKFEDWISSCVPEEATFVVLTDGIWDIEKFLNLQCYLSKVEFPSWAKRWIDIKTVYRDYHKREPKRKLVFMLSIFGMKFQGRLHSGKDDTYNIAQLAIRMLKEKYELDANYTTDGDNAKYFESQLAAYHRKKEEHGKRKEEERTKRVEKNVPKRSRYTVTLSDFVTEKDEKKRTFPKKPVKKKEMPQKKEICQKNETSPYICEEYKMDVDPELIGCEFVLLKHKRK